MRGTIGRSLANTDHFHITNVAKQNTFLSYSSFSTGGGGGRGRGRGGAIDGGGIVSPSASPQFDFSKAPGKPESDQQNPESPPSGIGHGRGRPPVNPEPVLPSYSSFMSSLKATQFSVAGRGRGGTTTESPQPSQPGTQSSTELSPPSQPSNIRSVLAGAGRGKPIQHSESPTPVAEENRHIRAKPSREAKREPATAPSGPPKPKLSKEEAVKHAVSILSQGRVGGGGGEEDAQDAGVGRGVRGGARMGGRGERGRGRGRGERRRYGGERRERRQDPEEGRGAGLFVGDNADGEKLAQRLGPENMDKLVQGFEEMSDRVLPSPMQDACVDAYHTNLSIELEPEYLMGDFNSNPDIDEKPPMSLQDMLEKVKPFLMSYEGIKNQEAWEEAVKQTLEQVPLMKEIVDHFSGPDRVTAKKQTEELERVASTLPEKAPDSVKRFANRAVISLQSNPVVGDLTKNASLWIRWRGRSLSITSRRMNANTISISSFSSNHHIQVIW